MNNKALKKNNEDIDYSFPKIEKKRWILILFGFFFIGLLSTFPIFSTIESSIKSALSSIPGCSVSFKEINFHFFLPKIVVTELNVPSSCIGTSITNPLKIKELKLNFRGISFAPFGPHFKLETEVLNNPLDAYITFGIFSHAINIKENIIDLEKLSPLLPEVKIRGQVELNALVEFSNKKIDELKIAASSKNLTIPGQKIFGFGLPVMNIGDLLLKGNLNQKDAFKLNSFILGNSNSPIRSKFNGSINLNMANMRSSRLDLIGEVSFSKDFISKLSLIEMAMQRFTKKDEFYQIAITGQMASPTVKSPDK